MKTTKTILMAVLMMTVMSCGTFGQSRTTQAGNATNAGGKKILVAYFSATGTTKKLAEYVASSVGADLYEIKPETPYTSADLNWHDRSTRATTEQNTPTARPKISGSVANMAQYDVVFVAYPIWWGQAPKIIYTFLESYDMSGKTIVPFCTSGSSGIGSSASNLKLSASRATFKDGKRFAGGTNRATMEAWAKGEVK